MLIPPIAQHTKAELVKMINKLEGPKVTVNKRKDVLIEILMDRMPFVDENGKELKDPVIPVDDWEEDLQKLYSKMIKEVSEEGCPKEKNPLWTWLVPVGMFGIIAYILLTIS